jgi:succinoglycan biosynthesis transport protein ExoP
LARETTYLPPELSMSEIVCQPVQRVPRTALAVPTEPMTIPSPPAVLSTSPTPLSLLSALRRRWLLAASLGTVLAMIGAAVAWFLPISWKARTLLHISSNRPYILFDMPDSRTDFANSQRSQLTLVKSRLVLEEALRIPEVAELSLVRKQEKPVEWLEKQLQVDFTQGPEILSIALIVDEEGSVSELVRLITGIRDTYMKEIVNKELNQRLKRLEELEKLQQKYDENLRERRLKVKELAETLGSRKSNALQLKNAAMFRQYESLQGEMIGLQSQNRKLEIELLAAEARHRTLQESKIPSEAMEERLKKHPDMIRLQVKVDELDAALQSIREKLSGDPEKNISYQQISADLAKAQKDLASRKEVLRNSMLKQVRDDLLAESESGLGVKRQLLLQQKELEKNLAEQIKKLLQEIETMSKGTVNLEWLDDEIAYATDVHKRVGAQIEQLKVETAAPSRISVLEDTYAQPTRTRSDRFKLAGMAALGLFGLAIFGVAFLEFSARRVSGVGEVTQGLGLRLVGVMPHVPAPAWNGDSIKKTTTRWQRMLRESMDASRTMLMHAVRHEGLRVVMITSAVKGEGKTLLSSHLAVSMAQSGFKTLLIDADFRNPNSHQLFDLPCSPGLSEVLRGEMEIERAVHADILPGLSMMPAGQWDLSLSEALAQRGRLATVLEHLKRQYHFILLDTAPILPAPDTLMIAEHVDGALVAILRGVSRLPLVYGACERLTMLGVRLLGAVVGNADLNHGYGYRYEARTSESV